MTPPTWLALACVVEGGCGFHPIPSSTIATPDAGCGAWLDPAWTARRALAVRASAVTGTHADFPLAVVIAGDADLGARARADGADLRFVDADGTTPLASEIERFDASTGTLLAWVRVPALSSAPPDHALYLYYGRTDAAPRVGSVWTGYAGVWHFADGKDSSGAGHDALGTAAFAPGYLGAALSCDGATNQLDVAMYARPTMLGYEAWIYTNVVTASVYHAVVTDWTANNRWFGLYGTQLDFYDGTTDHYFDARVAIHTWTHLAATYDGANLRVYENGAPLGTPLAVSYGGVTSPLQLGYNPNPAAINQERFDGMIDELRVSSVARSPEWIATAYANQLDPRAFVAVADVAHCP
jgi:hypothetical protein